MAGDAYYSSVNHVVLCNGTNGSTSFTDSGPAGRSIGNFSCSVTTTNPKFGPGACVFGPTAYDSIYLTDATSVSLPGMFAIDAWIRSSTFNGQKYPVFAYNDNTGSYETKTFAWTLSNHNTMELQTGTGPTQRLSGSVTELCDGTWRHVALTRDASNVIRQYESGTSFGGSWTDSTSWFNSSRTPLWGVWNNYGNVNGGGNATFGNGATAAMDCMRLTIGTDRGWNGSGTVFTPPASEADYLPPTGGPFPHHMSEVLAGGLRAMRERLRRSLDRIRGNYYPDDSSGLLLPRPGLILPRGY